MRVSRRSRPAARSGSDPAEPIGSNDRGHRCQAVIVREFDSIRSKHVVKDDVGDSGDGRRGDYFERG
jgi:hypothetical protein